MKERENMSEVGKGKQKQKHWVAQSGSNAI